MQAHCTRAWPNLLLDPLAMMLHGAEPPELSILMPASDLLDYPEACAAANGFPPYIQARHRDGNQPARTPSILERTISLIITSMIGRLFLTLLGQRSLNEGKKAHGVVISITFAISAERDTSQGLLSAHSAGDLAYQTGLTARVMLLIDIKPF